MKKPANKGFCDGLSLSDKLRKEGKSSEAFEIMLSALTLEELLGLKIEAASRLSNGRLYGFNLWSKIVDITKEALYNAVISNTKTNKEATRVLGITEQTFNGLKKKYKIREEYDIE
jgi:hypothetical protein